MAEILKSPPRIKSSATLTTPSAHSLQFPPLEQVNRPTVPTDQAAYYLNRQPQTLRMWACMELRGAIRPVRINGRLAWKISDIRALLESV